MKIPLFRKFLVFFLLWTSFFPIFAQEAEDITEFFNRGKECYSKRDLANAAVELENVLLLDPGHLDAKILLIRVYGDLKDKKKAQDILKAAIAQDPKNPELLELEKLFGGGNAKVTKKEGDLVLHETITLLGTKKPLRPFGLVIPETKVKITSQDGKPTGTAASATGTDDIDLAADEAASATEALKPKNEEGPLSEVFDVWAIEGLNGGLDKYFEIVGADRSLGAIDDQKLLKEGMTFFKPRFEANNNDEKARYFFGMITFFNGESEAGWKILEPLRSKEIVNTPGAKYVFAELDKKKAEEEARLAAIKKAQEEKEARERAEEEARRAEAAAAAAAASQTAEAGGEQPASGPVVVAAPGTPDALDQEGYELYKKGQLDQAVAKFQQGIKANANEPKIYYHMGLALTDKALSGHLDSFDRAIDAFNNVMRLSPGSKLSRDAEIMVRDITAAKNSVKP